MLYCSSNNLKNLSTCGRLKPLTRATEVGSGVLRTILGLRFRKLANQSSPAKPDMSQFFG